MNYLQFNNTNYTTIKEVYLNLCVTRNSIIKKIKKLEETGDILRIKNKKTEIYISQKGFEKLRQERIEYLNKMISTEKNSKMKEYYENLKNAIDKPELWNEFHNKEFEDEIYF